MTEHELQLSLEALSRCADEQWAALKGFLRRASYAEAKLRAAEAREAALLQEVERLKAAAAPAAPSATWSVSGPGHTPEDVRRLFAADQDTPPQKAAGGETSRRAGLVALGDPKTGEHLWSFTTQAGTHLRAVHRPGGLSFYVDNPRAGIEVGELQPADVERLVLALSRHLVARRAG